MVAVNSALETSRRGVSSYSCNVIVTVLWTVDANNAGSGELSIVVNNGDVPSSARLIAQNIYAVSFMPTQPGIHSVELFFNCYPLKGILCFIASV